MACAFVHFRALLVKSNSNWDIIINTHIAHIIILSAVGNKNIMKKESISIEALEKAVHKALKAWHKLDDGGANLLEELLLVQARRAEMRDQNPALQRLATNQVLDECLQELSQQDPEEARILRSRFLDDETILMVAHQINLSEDQVKRGQRKAIQSLTRILHFKETAAREERVQIIEADLEPSSYKKLYGVDSTLEMLVERLLTPSGTLLLALTGIGGIGKTSLADAVARQVIRHFYFEKVVWLRVPSTPIGQVASPDTTLNELMVQLGQRLLPYMPLSTPANQRNLQIRQTLKSIPYLVIIDNLEVEADTIYLLPRLSDLAGPTKFLLTTRSWLSGQTAIFHLPLKELSVTDALSLVREYAQGLGLAELAQAETAQLETIYQVVGGNPLALKLVVSLASSLPLSTILTDLTEAQSPRVEEMYRHIYWQMWQTLSEPGRLLLEVMPMIGHTGSSLKQMEAISGLRREQLLTAIPELVSRSLLERQGSTFEERYGIHRLTESFLRTEIIHWPENSV